MTAPRDRRSPSTAMSSAILAAVVLIWCYLRLFVFRDVVFPLTYVLPLMLCVWTRRRWQVWALFTIFALIAWVKHYMLVKGEQVEQFEVTVATLGTLVNISFGTAFVLWILSLLDRLDARNAAIATQNAELEAQAEELSQQNEEIRAQSEELAQQTEEIESQAEELERQNSELQESNERLQTREQILRSIAGSTRVAGGGKDALGSVCRDVLEIIGPQASAMAILELEEATDALRSRANCELPGVTPMPQHWPRQGSIAGVVLAEGKTAYVDDLSERPDLAAPLLTQEHEAVDKEKLGSILATPIRISGAPAGVLAVYSTSPAHWTSDQFRLIEWVAAQCGLILEGIRWQQQLADRAAEVESANRAKDQFLATLSHELRTPLTPVIAAAGALQADPRLPEDVREDIAMVRRNVAVQSRLIDDLLDLTRIARDKLELHREVLDVGNLLRQTASIVASDLDSKEQTLTMSVALPQGCAVEGDGARLQQVLWNLLRNSIKFSPTRARIDIRAEMVECAHDAADKTEPPRRLSIRVSDSGIGIEPADLSRIFKPFERAAKTDERRSGTAGLGLGLSIAKAVVEMHGGTIRASSPGRGKGSVFTIELPVAQMAPNSPQSNDAAMSSAPAAGASLASDPPRPEELAKPIKILLVEDHADTGRLLARLLKSAGYGVEHAPDVASAIDLTRKDQFDMVISDVGLPDGSGLDLMRQIRRNSPNFTGICLSGYGMEGDVRASLDAGFREHLTKPVDLQQLHAAIRRIVHARMVQHGGNPSK